MSQIYMMNKIDRAAVPRRHEAAKGPSVAELARGAVPTAREMGSRVDLPGEIREKMEASFGADFSNVKLYESETVAQAGANAVAQGSNIAFAPGKLDFASTAGQALLGHELSHVVSQARGESAGSGFLNDPRLEAQADRQGMMVARGESVYSGPVSPIGESSAVTASGPMQAKKYEDKAGIQMERQGMEGEAGDLGFSERRKLARAYDAEEKRREAINAPSSTRTHGTMPEAPVITKDSTRDEITEANNIETAKRAGNVNTAKRIIMMGAGNNSKITESQKDFVDWYNKEFRGENNRTYRNNRILTTGDGHVISGLSLDRGYRKLFDLATERGMKDDEIKKMMQDLMVKKRYDAANPDSEDPEERARAEEESGRTNEALMKMKSLYYGELKKVRDKYGVMMTQLHPEDAFNQAGDFWKDTHIMQDCMQLLTDAPELFATGNKEDEEFNNLTQYYISVQNMLQNYSDMADEQKKVEKTKKDNFYAPYFRHFYGTAKLQERNVLANDASSLPQMREKEMRAYRRKAMKKKNSGLGFDDFFKNEDEGQDAAAFMAADTMPWTETEEFESLEHLRQRKQERIRPRG